MGVRIVVRRGDVVPAGEHLDVGELMLDTGKVRLGIGLGGQQPIWLPGVSPVTSDLLLNPLQGIQGSGFGQNYWIGWPGQDFLQIRRDGYMRFGITADYNILQGYTIMTDGGRTDKDLLFGAGAGIPDFGASVIRNRPGKNRIYVVVDDNTKPVATARPGGMTTQTISEVATVLGAYQEQQAEFNRQMYSSGILGVRFYRVSEEDFNPRAKGSINGYSVCNIHTHSDFKNTCGMAEITALVNGYMMKTRHNDYRLLHAVSGLFGDREENEPVPVPANVLQMPTGFSGNVLTSAGVGTQTEWMRSVYDNNPDQCVVELSYMEVWLHRWDGGHQDMAASPRHFSNGTTFIDKFDRNSFYGRSGLNPANENQMGMNGVIATVDDEGFPVLAYLNYRISSMPVATLGASLVTRTLPVKSPTGVISQRGYTLLPLPYNPELAVRGITDTRNRILLRKKQFPRMFNQRTGSMLPDDKFLTYEALRDSGHALFDSPDLSDLCRACPGFDGIDHTPIMRLADPTGVKDSDGKVQMYNSINPRGFGFYDNQYAIPNGNASGLKNMRRGSSDLSLFTARTVHPEVVGGWTWMIPMELIVRTPRESWNPLNIPLVDVTAGRGTAADPYTGWAARNGGRYMTIPSDAIGPTGEAIPVTQADTFSGTWMKTGAGQPISVRSNGISMFDHDKRRRRFPVMPEASMFTSPHAEFLNFKHRLIPLLKEIRAGRATFEQIEDLV